MAYNRTYYFDSDSQANIKYRVEFYDQIASAGFFNQPVKPGKTPVKIKWGSDGSSMFAPFKPSTCTINLMVTNNKIANYIRQLRTDRQEQDVYVAVYREGLVGSQTPQYSPIWGGFLMMDLSDDPDQAVPYNVTLKAIDGIAALKYYDYVPTTTSQHPDSLYDIKDTFVPAPNNTNPTWRTFKQIIADCFGYLGEFNTNEGNPNKPIMRFCVGWFNGEMDNLNVEPLSNSRVKPEIFYKAEEITDDITQYKPKTCYQVLKAVCKAWGMRLFYWRNCYYFVQINRFRYNQIGNQANPDDIHNYKFELDGTTIGTSNTIQGFWGTYKLVMDSRYGGWDLKNKKRAGGQYGILPAFKKVTVDFSNVDNINRFTEFPPIPLTSSIGEPTSTGSSFEFRSLGTYTFDGINDQFFFQRIYLDVANNSGLNGKIRVNWGMFARQQDAGNPNTANASPIANDWTHMLRPDISNAQGQAWVLAFNWGFSGMPMNDDFQIPMGNSTIEITQSPTWGNIANFPYFPASTFTAGDWEICYYVESSATNADYGTGMGLYHWHDAGRFEPQGSSGGYNTSPWYYGISWSNVQLNQGIGASEFAPIISGAIGSSSTSTSLVQTGDDTAFQKITDILFGDTGNNQAEGCVQIYTGSTWQATDFSGIWGIDTMSGGNSMAQQLAEDIIKAQAQPIHKFTVQTVVDPSLGIYYNDGFANRPQYPFPGTKWTTLAHTNSATPGRNWIMHTGEFDLMEDTWKWVLYEQKTFTTSTTVTTTTTGGWNSGTLGGPNIPTGPSSSDDPGFHGMMGNPAGHNTNLIHELKKQQQKPFAQISADYYLAVWDGSGDEPTDPASLTITSLSVTKMPEAILKVGDKINVHTGTFRQYKTYPSGTDDPLPAYPSILTFEVDANQAADATSISVTSQVIYQNIGKGSIVTFDPVQIMTQGTDKTRGTIAGFTVDTDGLTKGGIRITDWLDSDTMSGASARSVPTSESVKSYVDTVAGTKQNSLTLTTTGTSGASTLVGSTLNIPNYETGGGGTANSNYKYFSCSSTVVTSATYGVITTIPFDTTKTESTTSNIVLYDGEGPSGLEDGAYCFTMGAGTYQIGWNVGTNTNTVNGRYLAGVKLQKGTVGGSTISWSDVEPSYSYIYDRGIGYIRKGSTSNTALLVISSTTTHYYRLVLWKERASNSATTVITLINATSLFVIQQQ